jgi:hypothetical protein
LGNRELKLRDVEVFEREKNEEGNEKSGWIEMRGREGGNV